MIFGLIRFSCSLGKMRSSDHARSSESKMVLDSYGSNKPRSVLRDHKAYSTPNLTLSHELVFETFQKLQGELIFG